MWIPILRQSEDYLVVNKPAGLLVHRSWLSTRETAFLVQILRDQIGQHVYPVHRLDRPTSGVMVLALHRESAHILAQQFEHHAVCKEYHAIVRGWTSPSGSIDYPLKKIPDDIADPYAQTSEIAQNAITDYETLACSEVPFCSRVGFEKSRYSLVRVLPKTGRKHQIRRHMKHIFHPILGDTTHGDLRQNQAAREYCGEMRLLLHARQLDFFDPKTGEAVCVCAPFDDVWRHIVQRLNLDN